MNRAGYLKHKDLIEAWSQGAEIEYYDYDAWDYIEKPNWHEGTEYRIKPVEPKKKTIVLNTYLFRNKNGYYLREYDADYSIGGNRKYLEILSTRTVEIDE